MVHEMHSAREVLQWHLDNGVDETIGEVPVDQFAAGVDAKKPRPTAASPTTNSQKARPVLASSDEAVQLAEKLARDAADLDALRAVMNSFELCPLKATASKMVFGDGNPSASIMFVGEAPGADEDRQGLPFVGVSGQLLDRMIGSIGLDRNKAYITNVLPWRPPGNRKPTPAETVMCLPFIRRHIALVAPDILVCVGGTSAQNLLSIKEGITRSRGRWFDYDDNGRVVPTMAMFHPAYLLRSPALKRDAWNDLLTIRARLRELSDA